MIESAGSEETAELALSDPARYYLLWFTTLADVDGGYGVEISDIRLFG